MNFPPPPPESKYFELFDGRWYFVLHVGGCEHLFNLAGVKSIPDEIRPIIAAVAAEEWHSVMSKLWKDYEDLHISRGDVEIGCDEAEDNQDAWREWGRKTEKENDNETPTA